MQWISIAAAAALWLVACATSAATPCPSWPAEVYLLRHAEKQQDASTDSPLSPAGWQRAGGLPEALKGARVGAILVSDKRRTQQTALALAAFTGVEPQVFRQQQDGVGKLVDAICTAGAAGVDAVVVVGHESTVPKVMEEIGVTSGRVVRPDFGDLFRVVHVAGSTDVDRRRYGDCP